MSDDLQARIDGLRNWRAWHDAIGKAKQSGDLTELVRLVCSDDPLTRRQLEEFSAEYRVVRKRRGRKKLVETVQDTYDIATTEVKKLRQDRRIWKRCLKAAGVPEWRRARIQARVRALVDGAIITVDASEEFNQCLTKWVRRLLGLGARDLSDFVAERRGLEGSRLANLMRGSAPWRGKMPYKK